MPAIQASLIVVVVVLFAAVAAAQDSQPDESPEQLEVISTFEIRISPLMDLMFYVRMLMEQDAAIPEVEGLAEAVRVTREVQESLGGSTNWGLFTGPSSKVDTAAEMIELCSSFPEQFKSRSGVTVALRSLGVKTAEALAGAEAGFRRELWPQREAKLQLAREHLQIHLKPRAAEVYEHIQRRLNISNPQPVVNVFLQHDMPWPGAWTYQTRGEGVCFVGIQFEFGSQIWESVIHETLHALQASSRDESSVFNELNEALLDAGVPRNDPLRRDVPHTVMFVQGAETVRRLLDPNHVDYGDLPANGQAPLYERQPKITAAVRPVWRAYLDGEIDRAEAVRRMVGGVIGAQD